MEKLSLVEMCQSLGLNISKEELERDDMLIEVACKLTILRSELGLTRTEAAKRSGISLRTLNKIESGYWNLNYRIDSLLKYAQGLGKKVVISFTPIEN